MNPQEKHKLSKVGLRTVKTNKRYFDFILYILIGFGIVAVVGITATYNNYRAFSWAVFGLVTLVLFGVLISGYSAYRKKPKLWAILAACLSVHLGLGILLITHIDRIQLVIFGVLYMLELPVLRTITGYFLTKNHEQPGVGR